MKKNSVTAQYKTPFLSQDAHHYVVLGWLILTIGLLSFLLWAAFAPLDKGISVAGQVVISGNRKIIQTPINGIVERIMVFEGQSVTRHQALIQLSQTQIQANVQSLRDQYLTMLATQVRLQAEREQQHTIIFPDELLQEQNNPRVYEIMALQEQLFKSRKQWLLNEITGYKQVIEELDYQIQEIKTSLTHKQTQQKSLQHQINNLQKLVKEGYFAQNRYFEIERNHAELQSNIAEINGRISQLEQQIQETEQRIAQRIAEHQQEIQSELTQHQVNVNDLRNKLAVAEFDLTQTSIVSPVEGIVVGLKVFTIGGVVAQGETLMDILPEGEMLEVEARLPIQLIDKVAPDMPADLMFTAFNQNQTPRIKGEVSMISADTLIDPRDGQPYYLMRLVVLPEEVEKLKNNAIKPGMSVEVFVNSGSRTLLNYLFKPLLDRLHTSLTEE